MPIRIATGQDSIRTKGRCVDTPFGRLQTPQAAIQVLKTDCRARWRGPSSCVPPFAPGAPSEPKPDVQAVLRQGGTQTARCVPPE